MLHPFLYADIKSYASRVSPLTLTDIAMPRPMAVTAREGEARTIRSLPLDLHTAFPVSEEKIYLSICDSTVLAQPVRAAVDRFLDQVMYWREERSTRDSVIEATRANSRRSSAGRRAMSRSSRMFQRASMLSQPRLIGAQ